MKGENLKWLNTSSVIIFVIALFLNAQSGINNGLGIIATSAIAQGTGSGGTGSGEKYYPVAVFCVCWDTSMILVPYGFHTICPSGSDTYCITTECDPPPDPSNCWNNDNL